MLMRFFHNDFVLTFVPTVYDSPLHDLRIDDTPLYLYIMDTSDEEGYERLRPLSYPKTHAIMICYAVNNRNSLEQVQKKWFPEARFYCPEAPLVLVGLKKDLRQSPIEDEHVIVSVEQAALVARQIHAYAHLECSAKTGEGFSELFEHAARATLAYMPIKSGKCCTLL